MDGRNRELPSSSSASRVPARFRPRRSSGNPLDNPRISSVGTANNFSRRKADLRRKPENREDKAVIQGGDPADVSFIIGTCPDMCPERERINREHLRDLAVFERLNGNPVKTSKDLAIKKFCRTLSALDVEASDVRPLPVLEETLRYVLNLLDSREHPFEVVHDFIFDRTRSIRQDLSMQNLVNERVIYLYEEMVKFHVISHHRLRRCSSPSISSMQHLNMEQLVKALTSLYNLYDANRKPDHVYENEAEYRSLYVLLHLDRGGRSMGEPLSLWFRNLTLGLVKSKEVCFARKMLRLFRMGNYKGFLCTIVSEATYLQYCVVEPYIEEMRSLAVQYINSVGYKLQPYPLTRLSKLLMMKEVEVESLCNKCGLETSLDGDGVKVLPTKQTTFCRPKEGCESCTLLGFERIGGKMLLESKLNLSTRGLVSHDIKRSCFLRYQENQSSSDSAFVG